jgi:hypothetical protein
MPSEPAEILKLDEKGCRRFENQVPDKNRYIIQFLLKIKSPQLRIEMALRIIENFKKCQDKKKLLRIF